MYDWFLISAAKVTSLKYCSCFLFMRLKGLGHLLLHKNKTNLLTASKNVYYQFISCSGSISSSF